MNATPALPQRISAISDLLQTMNLLAAPPAALTPAPAKQPEDAAKLAKDAGASATRIAQAVAALGLAGNDRENAQVIWEETIKQIARIQELQSLSPLPFQSIPSLPATKLT